MRSTDECEMSRSCHSATSSSAGLQVAAQHAGQPAELLGLHRVALVRHRARALLLARRGTAPRPRAPRCAAGGGSRARTTRCVAPTDAHAYSTSAWRSRASTCVAGTGVRPSALAHVAPRPRDRRWSTCRPRPRACRRRWRRGPARSRSRSRRTCMRPQRELGAERGGLGVDAVRAADHRRVAELVGPGGDRGLERRRRPRA